MKKDYILQVIKYKEKLTDTEEKRLIESMTKKGYYLECINSIDISYTFTKFFTDRRAKKC